MNAPASGCSVAAPPCKLDATRVCAASNALSRTSPLDRKIVVYVRAYSSTSSFPVPGASTLAAAAVPLAALVLCLDRFIGRIRLTQRRPRPHAFPQIRLQILML